VYVGGELLLQRHTVGPAGDFWVLRWIPLVYLVAAGIMLVRYYYLYACYYTKFLFRAFIALPDRELPSGRIVSPP
jgi:hypothetical protein